MYKVLFGITPGGGIVENMVLEDDEDLWNDFSLEYDMDNDYYSLGFETMIKFDDKYGCRNWIECCFDELTKYMVNNGYEVNGDLDMYEVFTLGLNVNSRFSSPEEAYKFLKLMVNGFHGDAL